MIPRRGFVRMLALLALPAFLAAPPARAQSPAQIAQATQFVRQSGDALVAAMNADQPEAQKKAVLQRIVDQAIDVDAVGRFCLGRYWRVATPAQRQQYIALFHTVLMNNVTSRVGQFRGIGFHVTRAEPRDGGVAVGTVITRPNNAPANVQWIVGFDTGAPKVIDMLAEGTSLRLTQRSDYASYLGRNDNDVNALIAAMRKQVGN